MKNILLVEPSKKLAQVVSASLESHGLNVVWEKDAQSAIHAADKTKPDAVITELILPDHNGLEFLYEFRSYVDWKNIPIVFYSQVPAEDLGLDTAQKRSLNIRAHLYKPTTSLKTLGNTLFEALA